MTIRATLASFSAFAGDDKQLVLSVTDENDAPLDLTGAAIVWRMSVDVRSYPFLTKDNADLGGIAISGDPTAGIATITLSEDDTLLPADCYYHEVRVTLDSIRATVVAAKATILPTLPG